MDIGIIMGKKISQASVKISKDEKQQFNSLIKVLRPKVYITDSSSFKKLVQELTGNGNSTTLCPPPLDPNRVENCPLVGSEVQRDPETSVEVSVSVSTEATSNSFETCYASLMNQEFDQGCNQMCVQNTFYQDSVANQSLDDLLAYQNLESLLFDTDPDPNSFYNWYAQIERQEEISIYDYEFYGLL